MLGNTNCVSRQYVLKEIIVVIELMFNSVNGIPYSKFVCLYLFIVSVSEYVAIYLFIYGLMYLFVSLFI